MSSTENLPTAQAEPFSRHRFRWAAAVARDKRLSPLAVRVAVIVAEFVNHRLGVAWPNLATLADAAGVTTRAVQTALAALEEAGYLTIEVHRGPGQSNR